MFEQKVRTVGKFSEVSMLRKFEPTLEIENVEFILQGRRFERWYDKNKKVIRMLSAVTPLVTCAVLGISAATLFQMVASVAVPVILRMTPHAQTAYQSVDAVSTLAQAGGGALGLFGGDGAILLHFLIIGFVTLIITTFLKFTGRGDLAPLVMFVAGGVMLLEVLSLFNHIYAGVKTFLTL